MAPAHSRRRLLCPDGVGNAEAAMNSALPILVASDRRAARRKPEATTVRAQSVWATPIKGDDALE